MRPRFELPPRCASFGRRILCVDDNLAFLTVLGRSLKASGFEAVVASQGADALMQYKAHFGGFEAVVTANEMPDMNGEEFIRRIRKMGFTGRLVLMSGNLSFEALKRLQDCRISGFFTKPFEIGLLIAMLLQGTQM